MPTETMTRSFERNTEQTTEQTKQLEAYQEFGKRYAKTIEKNSYGLPEKTVKAMGDMTHEALDQSTELARKLSEQNIEQQVLADQIIETHKKMLCEQLKLAKNFKDREETLNKIIDRTRKALKDHVHAEQHVLAMLEEVGAAENQDTSGLTDENAIKEVATAVTQTERVAEDPLPDHIDENPEDEGDEIETQKRRIRWARVLGTAALIVGGALLTRKAYLDLSTLSVRNQLADTKKNLNDRNEPTDQETRIQTLAKKVSKMSNAQQKHVNKHVSKKLRKVSDATEAQIRLDEVQTLLNKKTVAQRNASKPSLQNNLQNFEAGSPRDIAQQIQNAPGEQIQQVLDGTINPNQVNFDNFSPDQRLEMSHRMEKMIKQKKKSLRAVGRQDLATKLDELNRHLPSIRRTANQEKAMNVA